VRRRNPDNAAAAATVDIKGVCVLDDEDEVDDAGWL